MDSFNYVTICSIVADFWILLGCLVLYLCLKTSCRICTCDGNERMFVTVAFTEIIMGESLISSIKIGNIKDQLDVMIAHKCESVAVIYLQSS